ncbi:TVP38/TMEM64 family protein [Bacillus marasmi]|uniref:TVP38/TMEM64 family protein n=1 Tax=Bacillus marasmi TaxID=1926279 RepID=UPI0011CA25B2|nr:VTT domain-containing protein [Bacillus marasmi]
MKEQVVQLLQQYDSYALFISIILNVIISLIGFIPSLFLTAANIVMFGFWEGTLVSFVGEVIGAVVSFLVYRKGLAGIADSKALQRPIVRKLLEVEGGHAFILVFSLRLLPFVPSGVITFLAAIGRMSLIVFVLSSTLGKLPALLIEAYSANELIQWSWQGKIIITILAGFLLFTLFKKTNRPKKGSHPL